MTTIGIVSPGAMGSAVGRVLVAGGARVVATVAGRSERTRELARGIELLPSLDEVVRASDIVLTIVPPGEALSVADAVAAAARAVGHRPLVADLNAVAPSTARAVARRLTDAGLEAVDGSISGPPPARPGTTTIYLSGAAADRVAEIAAPGLRLVVVGAEMGAASAVKMSTAAVYKGLSAVLAQALRTAAENGVLDVVVADIEASDPSLVEGLPAWLQRQAAKAWRYVAEMEEIAVAQAEAGLSPALYAAIADVYRGMSTAPAALATPEEIDPERPLIDVLAGLREPPPA